MPTTDRIRPVTLFVNRLFAILLANRWRPRVALTTLSTSLSRHHNLQASGNIVSEELLVGLTNILKVLCSQREHEWIKVKSA